MSDDEEAGEMGGMGGRGGILADELEDRSAGLASSSSARATAEEKAALEMFDARVRARKMVLPTDDGRVRQQLRLLEEPITLFGERPPDRRARLREILVKRQGPSAERGDDAGDEAIESDDDNRLEDEDMDDEEDDEEEFFTEGTQALLEARQNIARFSLPRAAKRIAHQKRQVKIPLQTIIQTRKAIFEPVRAFTNVGSQIGDSRPISIVRFSPDGALLATGSWSGGVRLWDMPSARQRRVLRGHTDKVGGLAWHPQATLTQSETAFNIATGAADGNVLLWDLANETPMSTLSGHAARVARVEIHPSGKYVASASFDGTWKLWDAETQAAILTQEGHSKEVYAVGFQGDGALLVSGGLDAIGRLWDLRTGRGVMILDGHAREILSVDFSTNGYTVATASGDDTVKVWDLRRMEQMYSIPAHKSSCSDVRFFKSADERSGIASGSDVVDNMQMDLVERADADGADDIPSLPRSSTFLATSGYDGYVNVWSADDWQILRSMHGDSKAMSVDIHPQGDLLASGEWTRTFKLWGAL